MTDVMLIIGTAQLRGRYGVLEQSVEQSGDDPAYFLRTAHGFGFSTVDTAPAYPGAEEVIRTSGVRFDVHTKLDPAVTPEASIDGSLNRLGRDFVDVAYLHDPDAVISDGGAVVDRAASLTGVSIGALGASVYSAISLRAAFAHGGIGVVQIPVNPLNRELADIACQVELAGTRVVARSLLAQGLIAAVPESLPHRLSYLVQPIRQFQDACREIGRPPVEAALLWVRDHPALNGVIVGAASVVQLRALSSALHLPALSADEREAIDALPLPEARLLDPRSWS